MKKSSFLNTAKHWIAQNFGSHRHQRSASKSRLSFETLEQKNLFAGDVVVDDALIDPLVPAISDSPLKGKLANELEVAVNSLVDSPLSSGSNTPPVISNFQGIEGPPNVWKFSGTVTDDVSPVGLTVNFFGLLDGYTATVESNGNFSAVALLAPDAAGMVVARVTDADGLVSNLGLAGVEP